MFAKTRSIFQLEIIYGQQHIKMDVLHCVYSIITLLLKKKICHCPGFTFANSKKLPIEEVFESGTNFESVRLRTGDCSKNDNPGRFQNARCGNDIFGQKISFNAKKKCTCEVKLIFLFCFFFFLIQDILNLNTRNVRKGSGINGCFRSWYLCEISSERDLKGAEGGGT